VSRILLSAAPWSYRELRHPDGMDPVRRVIGSTLVREESTINGKMPFWSLLYLAAWLRRQGHEVSYVESYQCEESDFWEQLEAFDPDIIGLNAVTCTWAKTRSLISAIKTRWPQKLVVLGGAHCNVAKEACLDDCPDLDVAVFGEGEVTLDEIATRFAQGSRDFMGINGCAFRQDNGSIFKERKRALLDDVDLLPYPARDLLPEGAKHHPRLNIYNRPLSTVLFTGRGCPLTCSSCHLPAVGALKFRIRSPEHIFGEMIECDDRHGISDFGFYDHFGIFSSDETAARRLCELIIASGRSWTWTVTFWSYDFSSELLSLMKRAGCWRIDTVLISGVDKNLRAATMDSPLKVDTCREGVHRIHNAGIEVAARFSLGIAGESVAEARETIAYACSLPIAWAFFTPVNPVFGSRLWRSLDRSGGFVLDERSMNIFNVFYEPSGMSREQLSNLQKEAYRAFYGRPSFFASKASQALQPAAIRRNATLFSHLGRHIAGL
jgi:anaerobic magnesium-protoporphyrin IX monomethyl ester cyclase